MRLTFSNAAIGAVVLEELTDPATGQPFWALTPEAEELKAFLDTVEDAPAPEPFRDDQRRSKLYSRVSGAREFFAAASHYLAYNAKGHGRAEIDRNLEVMAGCIINNPFHDAPKAD